MTGNADAILRLSVGECIPFADQKPMKRLIGLLTVMAGTLMFHAESRSENDPVVEGRFAQGFEEVIRSDELLLTSGGAKLISIEGTTYFVAVGVTPMFPDTPGEALRRLKVGEANALREIAGFIDTTEVKASTELVETTTIVTTENGKSAQSNKTFQERIKTSVRTLLTVPEAVGTWQNRDGSLFFYAVGKALENESETTDEKR